MRSEKEFAEEALRRAAVKSARRRQKRRLLEGGAGLAACLFLITCICVFSESSPVDPASGAAANQAPLLYSDAGGYVLVGVIFFVIGVAVTLLCLRLRKRSG